MGLSLKILSLTWVLVVSWSLTQEVVDGRFEHFYCHDKYFLSLNSVNSVKTFRENSIRFGGKWKEKLYELEWISHKVGAPTYHFVDSERLSTRTSFQLEYEFLDTSEP